MTLVLIAFASAAGNILGVGSIIYALLRPTHGDKAKPIAAFAVPAAFNLAIICFKSTLDTEQRAAGLVATLLLGIFYLTLVTTGNLPPNRKSA